MTSKVQKLYQKAIQLSDDEREVFLLMLTNAARCNEANNGWASPEIERAWMEECDRRDRDYRAGKTTLIPVEESIRRAREHLRKQRGE
jgi:hypothetical protein